VAFFHINFSIRRSSLFFDFKVIQLSLLLRHGKHKLIPSE
jgi:hypothetical protein